MNMTRAITLRCRGLGSKDVYSIGRVQTSTLALVVRRDREIEAFKPRDYFEIVADVAANGERVDLRYAPKEDERIFDLVTAKEIAAKAKGCSGALKVEHERKKKSPPKLFSQAGFQIRTNALYGVGVRTRRCQSRKHFMKFIK
jgi:DNA topoisomerase-3